MARRDLDARLDLWARWIARGCNASGAGFASMLDMMITTRCQFNGGGGTPNDSIETHVEGALAALTLVDEKAAFVARVEYGPYWIYTNTPAKTQIDRAHAIGMSVRTYKRHLTRGRAFLTDYLKINDLNKSSNKHLNKGSINMSEEAKALAACPCCYAAPSESLTLAISGRTYRPGNDEISAPVLLRALVFCPECGAEGGEVEKEARTLAEINAIILAARQRWNVRDRRNAEHYTAAVNAGLIARPATVPELVERDEDGYWTHSEFFTPSYGREYGFNGEFEAWLSENGLQYSTVYAESDLEIDDFDGAKFDKWEPSRPEGDGWFIGSIHDTEDGPICVWLRAVAA